MKYESYFCEAAIGSVTEAMKAERLLLRAGIKVEVLKVDKATGRGCIYGIKFPIAQRGNVLSVLSASGIKVKD